MLYLSIDVNMSAFGLFWTMYWTLFVRRFVKFADEEAAKNSIVEVNGKFFQGARLSVRRPERTLNAYRGSLAGYTVAAFFFLGEQRCMLGRNIKVCMRV